MITTLAVLYGVATIFVLSAFPQTEETGPGKHRYKSKHRRIPGVHRATC